MLSISGLRFGPMLAEKLVWTGKISPGQNPNLEIGIPPGWSRVAGCTGRVPGAGCAVDKPYEIPGRVPDAGYSEGRLLFRPGGMPARWTGALLGPIRTY